MQKRLKIVIYILITGLILIMILSLSFLQLSAPTQKTKKNDVFVYQQLTDGNYLIVDCLVDEKIIVVDNTYLEGKIVGISESAFINNTKLEEIIISRDVELLDKTLFINSSNLEKILVAKGEADNYKQQIDSGMVSSDNVSIYEQGYIEIFVDGQLVDEVVDQLLIIDSEVAEIEVRSVAKQIYHLNNGKWEQGDGRVLLIGEVSWHYNNQGEQSIISEDETLIIDELNQQESYTVMVDDEIVLHIERKNSPHIVETGQQENYIDKYRLLICLGIIIIGYIAYGEYKRYEK